MRSLSNRLLLKALLHVIAVQYNQRRKLRKLLRHADGWFHFTVGFRTEDDGVGAGLVFADGRVKVRNRLPEAPDVTLVFRDPDAIGEMLSSAPNEVLNLLLRGRLRVEGNFSFLQAFNFFLSRTLGRFQRRLETRRRDRVHRERLDFAGTIRPTRRRVAERRGRLRAERVDPGVKLLDEPYLVHLGLDDLPRLRRFRDAHFTTRPELCDERARILTEHFRDRGFERDPDGLPRVPVLRQAEAFSHLMRSRQPIVRDGDLLAGTTTAKKVGVVLYPDAHGTLIWGELDALPDRELNPYDVSAETLQTLHHDVFPFWTRRNFRERVRHRHHAPRCQALDERFALYFVWKSVALSHTVPDFEKLLTQGTTGILAEIDA
ncbi:MAG: SCP2 sterol-binding domain-containing protein, partial [Deltaproteobacteria bacterium]|nr:SCP2 sterol-binding domain-containing protein [Deltaproteobacteria bacterium]